MAPGPPTLLGNANSPGALALDLQVRLLHPQVTLLHQTEIPPAAMPHRAVVAPRVLP